MGSLNLNSIVCVFDQAIYCKACEIKWREPAKFSNCVLMMGMFHMIMTYMHVLYKRFGSAGLKDALIQSAVVAEGSVEMALRGKCYNRGVRLYKLFYESLQRLVIDRLVERIGKNRELFTEMQDVTTFDEKLYEELSQSEEFQTVLHHYLDLKIEWKNSDFTLPRFWLSFIEMVDLLLNIIFACRAGKWELLLECIRGVIPYAFPYDHVNYARYLTVMLGDMLSLEENFPEVYNQCISGNFAAQLSDSAFSRVETDKVIEMTLNKDTKTPGGTTGFSTSVGAVKRWEVNASYRAALRSVFHQHLHYSSQSYQHKDLSSSRIIRDENDVQAILSVLRDSFVDPFSAQPLLSISTGIVVDQKASSDLLNAFQIGIRSMNTFMTSRFSEASNLSIFDPIKRLRLATFNNLCKKKVIQTKTKIISLETSKDLFSNVAIIAQKRAVDLKRLFAYPFVHLPLSLAEADGTLKKTAKSLLLHKLEGDVEPLELMRKGHTFIADGMAYVRQIKTVDLTYREFSIKMLKHIVNSGIYATRIDIVFDVYMENSIKDVERARRSSGEIVFKQIVPTSPIKQWNQLLSSGDFKNKLVSFLVQEWKSNKRFLDAKALFVTTGTETYKITTTSCRLVAELASNHEETDTRMLLHAKHASSTYNDIIISTPDTDVFMIALSKLADIDAHLYMLTGTNDNRRLIDLNAVGEDAFIKFNKTDCTKHKFLNAVLGFHCFTGCDTTITFAGRGKIKPLLLMGTCNEYVDAFSSLGSSLNIADVNLNVLQGFTCHMYGKKRHILKASQLMM